MILRVREKPPSKVKNKLKQLGYNSEAIRRAAIAMYEGEINHGNSRRRRRNICRDITVI